MKKLIGKLFNHAFFAIGVALGIGVLAMVGLVQVYDFFWGTGPTESVVENPVQRAISDQEPAGPTETLHIRQIPGPFISREGGEFQGVVYLNVALEVAGEANFHAAEEQLDQLVLRFGEVLKRDGVGRSDLPGLVDYDRLARTFLAVARDEVDLSGITRVTVSEGEDQ